MQGRDGWSPGRPSCAEAGANAQSLSGRSAPLPSSLRSRRIQGLLSLYLQARPERLFRVGEPELQPTQEALVNNTTFAGLEVSSQELLFAVSHDGKKLPLKSFPNSPEGHRAIAASLAELGRAGAGLYGVDRRLRPRSGAVAASLNRGSK